MRQLRDLLRDEGGAVAVAVALLLPVLIGVGAFAVDVSHTRLVKNRLQSAADAAALAGAQLLGDQPAARARAIAYARANVPEGFGAVTGGADVDFGSYDPAGRVFTPSAVDVNAIRVVARRDADRGNAAPRFLAAIFGEGGLAVGASAIAARTITTTYGPPELFDLAPEAADYNEVYAYCYKYDGSGSKSSRRTKMTLIARNITPAVKYTWPECPDGQSMSFRLRNIRDARNNPQLRTSPNREEYNHYSDTVIEESREVFDFGGRKILETYRCDTLGACKPTSEGGVVPYGKNREPVRDDRPCVPGKFMYFGWEDRPPGLGWTDQDYDDIVFVMRCPTGIGVEYGASRLVK
ncbi:pilus assembly protein TadG-related protein [Amaricoccus sp.]|uniref:pilus assembly protein TadG-related protein n=1 Tax=Amaricoccus sp. TaxID=1872485 RepID=UPI001B6027BD|nr:pilus assembly protein TadG-related protein [Amaricoccus sp.]MBP6999917.1 hypothetical protein [Amaricoccus sp.]